MILMLTVLLELFLLVGCPQNTPPESTSIDDSLLSVVSEKNEPTAEDEMFKYLNNTYYKLTNVRSLNIVYIGGSVTDGYGASDQKTQSWVAHTTNWFKESFPDAKITSAKKSIGGTGSYLADFRFDSEVASQEPDLLFIEFAINDKYNGEKYDRVVRTSETLVRKAYAANPNIDIVYVLTFDSSVQKYDYEQLRAHRDVAKEYGLPVIKLGESFYKKLQKTGDEFSKYFMDGVHPNDEGYKFYSEVIIDLLSSELIKENAVQTSLKAKSLPEKQLSKFPLMTDARLVTSDKIDLSEADGWNYQYSNFSYLGMRYNGRIFSNTVGSKFTLTFEGTDFGLCYGIGPSMGKISCTIDGGDPIIIDAYRANLNPKEMPIAWNIEAGTHTVVIELLTEKNDASTGHNFEIGALLVN